MTPRSEIGNKRPDLESFRREVLIRIALLSDRLTLACNTAIKRLEGCILNVMKTRFLQGRRQRSTVE